MQSRKRANRGRHHRAQPERVAVCAVDVTVKKRKPDHTTASDIIQGLVVIGVIIAYITHGGF